MSNKEKKKLWSVYCIYWSPLKEGETPRIMMRNGSISSHNPTLRTYVGITNNHERRIRQHNGEIVGGAKYTTRTKGGVWKFVYLVSGFPNGSVAAQWEYRLHRRGKRLNKKCVVCNRVAILRKTAEMESVTKTAPLNSNLSLTYNYPQGLVSETIPTDKCVCFLCEND